MKKWIGICILCLFLSSCRSDNIFIENKNTSTPNDSVEIMQNEILVLIICPTGTMDETYSMELSQDGMLTTTMGIRKEEDISAIKQFKKDDFYLRIEKKESVTLFDSDFVTVDGFIDKIETEDNSKYENYEDEWIDSWTNILLTSQGVYYFNFNDDDIDVNSSICKLYNFLKSKSPIEINLHGWA